MYLYSCVYVCLHVHVYVYCTCLYICMCMCVNMCMNICVLVCLYIYVCVYVYFWVHAHVCICVYVCMWVCVCICVRVWVCISGSEGAYENTYEYGCVAIKENVMRDGVCKRLCGKVCVYACIYAFPKLLASVSCFKEYKITPVPSQEILTFHGKRIPSNRGILPVTTEGWGHWRRWGHWRMGSLKDWGHWRMGSLKDKGLLKHASTQIPSSCDLNTLIGEQFQADRETYIIRTLMTL